MPHRIKIPTKFSPYNQVELTAALLLLKRQGSIEDYQTKIRLNVEGEEMEMICSLRMTLYKYGPYRFLFSHRVRNHPRPEVDTTDVAMWLLETAYKLDKPDPPRLQVKDARLLRRTK